MAIYLFIFFLKKVGSGAYKHIIATFFNRIEKWLFQGQVGRMVLKIRDQGGVLEKLLVALRVRKGCALIHSLNISTIVAKVENNNDPRQPRC